MERWLMRFWLSGLSSLVVLGLALAAPPGIPTEVAPIVKTKCLPCHNANTHSGGLDLSVAPAPAMLGRIVKQVEAGKMPPGAPLPPAEKARFAAWVKSGSGATWWSLRPVPPPAPAATLDGFIEAGLKAKGLSFSPEADKRTLLRRVALDLTGLPPTPEETAAFLADKSPNAYEKRVDALLASPAYGERWARHWLDVARFGESHGFERDQLREHSWRYRDWVINALNSDLPYDEFVRQQVAGDVLYPDNASAITATGFLVGAPWDEVGQTQASALARARTREEELEELIGTVGQAFLGLSVQCARCHDHKFDPIPTKDYYRFRAALSGVRHGTRPLPSPAEKRLRVVEAQLTTLDEAARKRITLPGQQKFGPAPTLRWSFDEGPKDSVRGLPLHMEGGAQIAAGRLKLPKSGAFAATDALPLALGAKTLEAWVALPNRTQRGGGVISVELPDGTMFDAIVYGERDPGKWATGSDNFRRSRSLNAPVESAAPDALIHVAAVYEANGRIQLYRNGVPYGESYATEGPLKFTAGNAKLLLGMRHTGGGNAFLTGELEEARVYDRALSAEEVAASYAAGVAALDEKTIEAALTEPERAERRKLKAERANLLVATATPAQVYACTPRAPEPGFVLARGDVESPKEPVTPGALSALPGDFSLPATATDVERRTQLARWLSDAKNPLTARVMVNRVWQGHFGRGIVGTSSDFGAVGETPSHPELLDWLAATFMKDGWSIKKLHKRIVLSRAYKQASAATKEGLAKDADDRLLWRFAPRRLEAEAIRDDILFTSGRLNTARGGPGFRPFKLVIDNSYFYNLIDSDAPEFRKRSIYRIQVQSARPPLLEALDCPDPSTRTPRRTQTVTPLQALELMNAPFILRQAHMLAEAIGGTSDPVATAYRRVLGRSPSEKERTEATTFVKQDSLEGLCWALFNSSEFLYLR
ncbi:MAG: DUF1553 domain-containing protein [Armatimonas sp.]